MASTSVSTRRMVVAGVVIALAVTLAFVTLTPPQGVRADPLVGWRVGQFDLNSCVRTLTENCLWVVVLRVGAPFAVLLECEASSGAHSGAPHSSYSTLDWYNWWRTFLRSSTASRSSASRSM